MTPDLVSAGLFGYNGILTGLALGTFRSENMGVGWLVIPVIFYSALSSVIFLALSKLLLQYKVPCFTLPFNIATAFALVAAYGLGRFKVPLSPGLPVHAQAEPLL